MNFSSTAFVPVATGSRLISIYWTVCPRREGAADFYNLVTNNVDKTEHDGYKLVGRNDPDTKQADHQCTPGTAGPYHPKGPLWPRKVGPGRGLLLWILQLLTSKSHVATGRLLARATWLQTSPVPGWEWTLTVLLLCLPVDSLNKLCDPGVVSLFLWSLGPRTFSQQSALSE